jgi:hypothetical protein
MTTVVTPISSLVSGCTHYRSSTLINHRARREGRNRQQQHERTRGATKKSGTYTEPGDEEGLDAVTADGQDGTSATR